MNLPKDASGTEFDPFEHNLVGHPPQPELSTKGNFVKVRGREGNDPKQIEIYLDGLAESGVEKKTKELEQVVASKPNVTAAVDNGIDPELVAKELNARIVSFKDNILSLAKDHHAAAVNLANHTRLSGVVRSFKNVGIV